MSTVKPFWGSQALPVEEHVRLRIGPLSLWLARRGDELHCAFSRKEPDPESMESRKPDGIEWSRWICGHGALLLRLRPILPPRSVVVRPAMPLQVLPGQKVNFFVSIPVYVCGDLVEDGHEEKPVMVFDEPTVVLSNSWFGKPVNGELCYALRTRARRTVEELRTDAHLAVCPLALVNQSAKPMLFERLCLRAPLMRVYAGAQHLWTSPARLIYRGEDPSPGLVYSDDPPPYDGADTVLSAARETLKRGMMERAMDGMRSMGSSLGRPQS